MNTNELVDYFCTHKGAINRSALELSLRTHSSIQDVQNAKTTFRNNDYKEQCTKLPKILIFDIETAPVRAFIWKLWKENISIDQIIDDWFVICWSAKWLYSNEIVGECLTPEEIIIEDDSRIVQKLWELFDQADIVVAHNGREFDVPKMNTRFLYYGLTPPSPYKIVDTLQVAKKQFRFTSNKLNALADFFGLPNKLDTDFKLWKNCIDGNQEALDYMFEYNKYDVELLENVYIRLLPWIPNHPNIANYINSSCPICCNCGSHNLEELEGKYYKTQVGTYKVYKCAKCGAISRGRENIGVRPKTANAI